MQNEMFITVEIMHLSIKMIILATLKYASSDGQGIQVLLLNTMPALWYYVLR